MALTERQIDELVEAVLSGSQERFLAELTASAVSGFERAMAGVGGSARPEAQLEQLARTWPAEARRLLAEYAPAISDEVAEDVEAALSRSAAEDAAAAAAYTGAGAALTETFRRQAQQAAKGVAGIVRRQNVLMEQAAERLWYEVCDEAVNRAVLGTMPEREIVARGVARMGSIGCTHVTYGRDGRKTVSNFVDVAVRRHVRTQTAQAAGRMTMDVLASYGHDLVVTDAHWGARPEHAEWQGKPCCLRGRRKMDGAEYPDIRDLTGYGTVTGLHGANCTHSISPYYPGVTPLPDRDFEAFERHYGMTSDEYYEATQKQRAWERRIRQTKREVAALEQADFGLESPTYVQKRLVLGRQQASLAKLCREKNLVRQYNREHAYGVKEQPRALRTGRSFDYSKAKAPSVIRMHSMDTFAADYAAPPVERGMVFDRNGNDLMRKAAKGTRNHVDIPLPDGCKDWHDLHVAHTHPDGGTLSLKDVYSFNEARPLATSVVTNEGVYTLAPSEGATHRWVGFTKGYEVEYASKANALWDARERYLAQQGRRMYPEDRTWIEAELSKAMHLWMKSNAGRYGFDYGFREM